MSLIQDALKSIDFDIMSNTKNAHYEFNGVPVPRTTEILSTMIHKDSLMYWANSLGFKGLRYKEVLIDAANMGTIAHAAIERFLKEKLETENNIPFLGICLGMQILVIAYSRYVCGLSDANSGEFDPDCKNKVIDFMPGQSDEIEKGGTLRLGAYPCNLKEGSVIRNAYDKESISERHRHRYEVNNDYREVLEKNGLTLAGISPDGRLVETVELSDRPFYLGVQYHPEFKSRPHKPHPLFMAFIKASIENI